MYFGAHLSISGGMKNAPERGQAIGCRALQIFCGNPRGWKKNPLSDDEIRAFKEAVAKAQIQAVVVHATYLINLAAPDQENYQKSCESFKDELRRSAALGAQLYVIHSGSHKGEGAEAGRARIVRALQEAHREVPERPEILLENTAGQKNSLGTTFEDLALLLDAAEIPRSGICLDTCHALAAGYEIRTRAGAKETLDRLDRALSFARLRCLHLNDSKGTLGSHLDRHEHIGLGEIGREGFKAFLSDPRLQDLPAILETPQDDPDDDLRNMIAIAQLAGEAGVPVVRSPSNAKTTEKVAVVTAGKKRITAKKIGR